MATIPSIDVPNPDAADVLAALEQSYRSDAINMFHSGSPVTYDALSGVNKARDCIRAFLRIQTRSYRRRLAQEAISVAEVETT